MHKPSKSETQVALIAMSGVVVGFAVTATAIYAAFRVPKHLRQHLPAEKPS